MCDIIFLVRLQEKFDIDHSGSERVNEREYALSKLPLNSSFCSVTADSKSR